MLDAIKPLLDSDLVNEDTKKEIQEAWDSKLNEVREEVTTELREEFAQKYEHDKSIMVEALDKMVNESLSSEINQIVSEKKALAEDRVKFHNKMREAAKKFDSFMVEKLAEEIKELRADRKKQMEATNKLESFVVKSLAEEIEEFQTDKKDLAETKVRLVTEAKSRMAKIQKEFVKRSAALVQETFTKRLTHELSQLKEDINAARMNDFGKKIFEAFAAEYSTSHLNTNVQVKQLEKVIAEREEALAEAEEEKVKAAKLVESKERELNRINDRIKREKVMRELLQPLNREKANAMKELLENVQTSKLREAFEKYRPALLERGEKKPTAGKQMVSENRKEITGDKKTRPEVSNEDDAGIIELRKLAGMS